MSGPNTSGIHHIGLAVSRLQESVAFFTGVLGWRELRTNEEHRSAYVSDGETLVTLWATWEEPAVPFDRRKNVGLHHVAFRVDSEGALHDVYEKLMDNGIAVEFAPEQLGQGPAVHMICLEPSGIRVEFIWPGS